MLPEQNIVRMLFGTLYGQSVTVKPRIASEMGARVGPFVATYGNGRPRPLGIVLFDLPMAAISSSALTRIPPATVTDAIKNNALNEMMEENFSEVMNLCSRLLGRRDGPAVRFEHSYSSPAVAPDSVRDIIAEPLLRDDWEITVPGYGSGAIAIMSRRIGE